MKKLSYGEIAKSWIESKGDKIKQEVLAEIIKPYGIFDGVPLEGVFKEIESGDSQLKEIREKFKWKLESYTSPILFKDIIKKAVKRIETRIKKMDLPSEPTSKFYKLPENGEK